MDDFKSINSESDARLKRRQQIVNAALELVGLISPPSFDPIHSPLCAVDVVMVAGAPWLKEALERDFLKDESGYKKIGGGANTPKMSYFLRSAANLIHFLKRQGLYTPRGGKLEPASGMACFFDWDDRGRFNFSPDRTGIVCSVSNGQIKSIVMAVNNSHQHENNGFVVEKIDVIPKSSLELAFIGYSDLP